MITMSTTIISDYDCDDHDDEVYDDDDDSSMMYVYHQSDVDLHRR